MCILHQVQVISYSLLMIVVMSGCGESLAENDSTLQFEVTHFSEGDGLAYPHAATTAVCPNGDAWFGYGIGESGITRFDGADWETLTAEEGLPQDSVYALACDRSGVLWIGYGINAGGLTRYDGETWSTYTEIDGLSSDRVATIDIGQDSEIWIGFGNQANGVDRLEWSAIACIWFPASTYGTQSDVSIQTPFPVPA